MQLATFVSNLQKFVHLQAQLSGSSEKDLLRCICTSPAACLPHLLFEFIVISTEFLNASCLLPRCRQIISFTEPKIHPEVTKVYLHILASVGKQSGSGPALLL